MVEELVNDLLSELPEDAASILMSLPPDAQETILTIAAEQGVDAAIEMLYVMAEDLGLPVGPSAPAPDPKAPPMGVGGVEAAGPPMDPSLMPPPEVLAGLPGGGPPPGVGLPPDIQSTLDSIAGMQGMGGPGGPPPEMGAPGMGGVDPLAPPAEGSVVPDKPKVPTYPENKVKEPPKWKPKPLPKTRFRTEPPSLSRVLEDERTLTQEFAGRDERIEKDVAMVHGTYDLDLSEEEGKLVHGEWVHRRADPWVYLQKVVALAAATGDRYKVHVPKRHPDDKYRDAAQFYEDFLRYAREKEEERWFERGTTVGDPQMVLPRLEAGRMALEGAIAWKYNVDPEDEELPFEMELVPASQVYPGGHATVRVYKLPLHKARAEFKAIEKAYPIDNDGRSGRPNNKRYRETQEIKIIEWADAGGYWHAIAWKDASPYSGVEGKEKSGWVQKPQKIGFGFPMFSYVQMGGTFATPMTTQEGARFSYFQGMGVITRIRQTFRLMDIMVSAVATGAIRFVKPPVVRKVAEGRDMMLVPELDWSPEAENFVREGEDVKPLGFEIAQSANGTAFIQALSQELNAAIPPMLMGNPSQSVGDRLQQAEDANASVIGPIIDALQRAYEMMNRQRGILAYRYSKRSKGEEDFKDREYFDSYQFVGTKKRGLTYSGELKPTHLELSGVANQVRYDFKTITERMQLAQYVTQLTQAHLMENEEALILLGRDDPQSVMKATVQDAAMMEPDVLKASIEAEILTNGTPEQKDAWIRVFYMRPQAGSAPAQPGTPSAPALPPEVMGGPSGPGGMI